MNEPIYTTLNIGGTIPKSLLEELAGIINDDFSDLNDSLDADSVEDFVNKTFCCSGFVNWGDCDNTTNFCMEHNLSYTVYNEAKDEYEANVKFWLPGMDEEIDMATDTNQHPTIRVGELKPYLHLLIDMFGSKDPTEILPLYTNDEILKDVIADCLKDPDNTKEIVKKAIDNILPPDIPELPDFIIDENN